MKVLVADPTSKVNLGFATFIGCRIPSIPEGAQLPGMLEMTGVQVFRLDSGELVWPQIENLLVFPEDVINQVSSVFNLIGNIETLRRSRPDTEINFNDMGKDSAVTTFVMLVLALCEKLPQEVATDIDIRFLLAHILSMVCSFKQAGLIHTTTEGATCANLDLTSDSSASF